MWTSIIHGPLQDQSADDPATSRRHDHQHRLAFRQEDLIALLLPVSDFETMKSGLQYKDAKVGSGAAAAEGDRVVLDWEGYTIGD